MNQRSFSNGNGGDGSGPGSPYWAAWRQGWDIRPESHWTLVLGRTPC